MSVEVLRPSSNGYLMELTKTPSGNTGYDCIDEATLDVADYLYWRLASWKYSFCAIPESQISAGDTINKVTVYAYIATTHQTYGKADIGVYVNSTQFLKGEFVPETSATLYSWELLTNPDTSDSWTLEDVQAMQIGVGAYGYNSTVYTRIYQLWVEIDYTPAGGSPAIWGGTWGG